MLETLMTYLNNWFPRQKYRGRFVIQDGALLCDGLIVGQYYRIKGSILNDGLHKFGECALMDETFDGEVWGCAPPRAFIELAEEIEQWAAKNADALSSPYTSENVIGVYSYTMKTGASGSNGNGNSGYSWQDQFRSRLNPYRRLPDAD